MRGLLIVFGVLLTTIATACSLGNVGAPSSSNPTYAVIYGRIGAPAETANIDIIVTAYKDSAEAVRDSNAGVTAADQVELETSGVQPSDTSNTFVAFVVAKTPGTYFVNVFATGQGSHGFVSSVDTVRALPVMFDSLGGGPHDSIAVYDSLP
jgi:hypothetical protein